VSIFRDASGITNSVGTKILLPALLNSRTTGTILVGSRTGGSIVARNGEIVAAGKATGMAIVEAMVAATAMVMAMAAVGRIAVVLLGTEEIAAAGLRIGPAALPLLARTRTLSSYRGMTRRGTG
jgi:hypothetical protein